MHCLAISKALLVDQFEEWNKIKRYFSCYNIFECVETSSSENTFPGYFIATDMNRISVTC